MQGFSSGLRSPQGYSSVDKLMNSDQPIYVINNTEPRALLICTVNDPISGKAHTLNFHRTFIPFCLTDMLPREVLQKSIQLRTYLQKGVLKLLGEQEALVILDSEEGQAEYARLMQSEFSGGSGGTERKQAMLDAEITSHQAKQGANIQNPDVDYAQMEIHPKVKSWEQRVLAGELDGPTLLTELRIHATEFTQDDLKFMLTHQFPQEAKDFSSKNLSDGKFKKSATATKKANSTKDYEPDWG